MRLIIGSTLYIFCASALAFSAAMSDPLAQPQEMGGIFTNCGDANDLVRNLEIVPSPWPPRRGQPLQISVSAELTEPMVQGAFAEAQVKLGVIRLPKQRIDLCEIIKESKSGLSCPVAAQHLNITETVDMPSLVPPGTVYVTVTARNPDNKRLMCIRAEVSFARDFDESIAKPAKFKLDF